MLAKVNSSAVVGLDAVPSEADNHIYYDGGIKELEDEWQSIPAKHPTWYCKKRKGKHKFLLVKEEEFWILPGKWQTFRCGSCGKKKLKHLRSPNTETLAK